MKMLIVVISWSQVDISFLSVIPYAFITFVSLCNLSNYQNILIVLKLSSKCLFVAFSGLTSSLLLEVQKGHPEQENSGSAEGYSRLFKWPLLQGPNVLLAHVFVIRTVFPWSVCLEQKKEETYAITHSWFVISNTYFS